VRDLIYLPNVIVMTRLYENLPKLNDDLIANNKTDIVVFSLGEEGYYDDVNHTYFINFSHDNSLYLLLTHR
jgi:hypothetical protein